LVKAESYAGQFTLFTIIKDVTDNFKLSKILQPFTSVPKQLSNAIPTALPMFLGSSCPTGLVAMMYDQQRRNWKLKIQDGGLQTENASIFTCDTS